MADSITESDVLMNRMNVVLAKCQRLVASWHPEGWYVAAESDPRSSEEIEREERETFAPVPDTLGFGATLDLSSSSLPSAEQQRGAGDLSRRYDLASNERLREQLLGKEAAKAHRRAQQQKRQSVTGAPGMLLGVVDQGKGRGKQVSTHQVAGRRKNFNGDGDDDDDNGEDEGGRSSIGRKHRKARIMGETQTSLSSSSSSKPLLEIDHAKRSSNDDDNGSGGGDLRKSKSTRASRSYLDEVLEQRERKRRKKKGKGAGEEEQ